MPPRSGSARDRAGRHLSSVDAQDGLFDKQWQDTELEAALEALQTSREAATTANKDLKLKRDAAKGQIARFSLDVGEVARCGRFKIKKREVAGSSVAFDTTPREQLDIGVIAE
jgi:hypothetical protein